MKNANTDAPLEIRRLVRRFGGLNPFGRPLWRVCLAQNVRVKRGGIFHELEGVKSMVVMAPDGKRYYRNIKDRIRSGVFEVPRYPHQGWIMERWQPAHIWGTKESWEAHRSEDGTPMMGPFPAEGDYWMINGPFDKLPDWGDMECSIAQYEKQQRMRPQNLAAAIAQALKDEKDAEEARLRAFEAELTYIQKTEFEPMLKSLSLEAQRFRNDLNTSLGIRSEFHVI